MNKSDTGYICEKAKDDQGDWHSVQGNYFVYAGDEVVYYNQYSNMQYEKCVLTSMQKQCKIKEKGRGVKMKKLYILTWVHDGKPSKGLKIP